MRRNRVHLKPSNVSVEVALPPNETVVRDNTPPEELIANDRNSNNIDLSTNSGHNNPVAQSLVRRSQRATKGMLPTKFRDFDMTI